MEILDLGSAAPPRMHPDFGRRIPIHAFAIESPTGIVLVDTGLGEPEPALDRMYQPERRSLATALSENRLALERVKTILLSHMHFDHVGGITQSGGIPIHVQRSELEAARREPRYTLLSRFSDPALQYVQHDGDAQFLEGIRVITTPGHTPGHQSVAIDTPAGLILLACQAAYVLEEWADPSFEHPAGAASAWNHERYRESLNKLRALNPIEVRFSHDRRIWRTGS